VWSAAAALAAYTRCHALAAGPSPQCGEPVRRSAGGRRRRPTQRVRGVLCRRGWGVAAAGCERPPRCCAALGRKSPILASLQQTSSQPPPPARPRPLRRASPTRGRRARSSRPGRTAASSSIPNSSTPTARASERRSAAMFGLRSARSLSILSPGLCDRQCLLSSTPGLARAHAPRAPLSSLVQRVRWAAGGGLPERLLVAGRSGRAAPKKGTAARL